jgi:hypothetical protein
MAQFVGSYNTRRSNEEQEHRRLTEAKFTARKDLQARKDEIVELVRLTFWAVERHNRRDGRTMAKAYATAESLAKIGGEDYKEAVTVLRFAKTGPAAYADACAAMLVGVND